VPMYEFICGECETDFEKLVFPSTIVACPTCEGRDLTRRVSVFGLKTGLDLIASTGGGCGCGAGGCGCARG